MTNRPSWFIDERAIAFASLLLTKNADVALRPHAVGRDEGLDLLIEILRDGKPTLRFLGVRLAAFLDLPDPSSVDERISSDLAKQPREVGLPLAIFVIGVRQPEGIYRWLVEPVVEDGRALLRHAEMGSWQSLDEEGVARLIDRVNGWYEVLNRGPSVKSPDRHAKKGSQ